MNLGLSLGPHSQHASLFPFKVVLHFHKLLNDDINAISELFASQVSVHQIDLCLPTLFRLPRQGQIDQGLPHRCRDWNSTPEEGGKTWECCALKSVLSPMTPEEEADAEEKLRYMFGPPDDEQPEGHEKDRGDE